MFKGSLTALVTPFKNGQLDLDALKHLVDWQIESGTQGLVPVGTTGESPTLSPQQPSPAEVQEALLTHLYLSVAGYECDSVSNPGTSRRRTNECDLARKTREHHEDVGMSVTARKTREHHEDVGMSVTARKTREHHEDVGMSVI